MFAQRLRELRTSKNLDQKDIANALGVLDATVSMWETGKRVPYHELLIKIADFFDVSIDYLLGYKKNISVYEQSLLEKEVIKKFLTNAGYIKEEETLTDKELEKLIKFINVNKEFLKE